MKYIVLFCLFIFVVSINMTATIEHLTDNALSKSSGNCAKYVANALEAGDFVFTRQNYAYQYWSNRILIGIGYYEINETSSYEKGDITVTENNEDHEEDHGPAAGPRVLHEPAEHGDLRRRRRPDRIRPERQDHVPRSEARRDLPEHA